MPNGAGKKSNLVEFCLLSKTPINIRYDDGDIKFLYFVKFTDSSGLQVFLSSLIIGLLYSVKFPDFVKFPYSV